MSSSTLPLPAHVPLSMQLPRHPFNTHKFASKLETATFSRGSSSELTKIAKQLIKGAELRAASERVAKGDLENVRRLVLNLVCALGRPKI